MRSTKPERELLNVASNRKSTTKKEKLVSKESIAGSNDSVPSTHCSDEESHTTDFKYPGEDGVEIVSIRRVSSSKDESEEILSELIKEESSELIKEKGIEACKKESSKTGKTTKKQGFRGLFGSNRGEKKPPSQQTQKVTASTKKTAKPPEATPTVEAISSGPSSLLRQISISVEIRPEFDDEDESLGGDPEKKVTTSVGVTGTKNEDDLEDELSTMRSSKPEGKLLNFASNRKSTTTNEKLVSKESITRSNDSASKKESSETGKTTKKQGFRGLFGSNRGGKKPPSHQSQKVTALTKKAAKPQEAAPTMEAITPGPSSLLRQILISVQLRPEIDDEVESLKDDPEKEVSTSVVVTGMENENDLEDEPLLNRIVAASDLAKVTASAKTREMSVKSDTNLITVENTEAKAGDISARSDPVLSTMENTEAKAGEVAAKRDSVVITAVNAASSDETIEIKADGTTSSAATTVAERSAPIVVQNVAPTIQNRNILDTAGIKVDALVDAFFLLTSCGRIDSACYGMETDPSIDGDTLRRILSDDYDTLRSDADDDATFLTLDNSLLEDDETLRTFLEEDGTLGADDDTLRPSEEVKRAIVTLKWYASRLGVSETELLQRIRDEQEKRTNENTQESPPADDT